MKRIQLFEFEDFHWFPESVRTYMTNLLVVLHKMMGTSEVLAILFDRVQSQHNFDQIVDIGSGSGGAMPDAVALWNERSSQTIQLLLSDLYPNTDLVTKINTSEPAFVNYSSESVDATHIENAPKGSKTMIASFHHMPPTQAKQILASAQSGKAPLLIYEIAENKIPTIIWWLLLPLSLVMVFIMALILTPFVRPLSFGQLFFTYIIPIVPMAYAWDGQASMVRTYTFEDIKGMLPENIKESYTWSMAPAIKSNGKEVGYYVLGMPK